MASNKTGLGNTGRNADASLANALLKIIAFGVAGGALLIGGAKNLGEMLLDHQENNRKKLEKQRELDKEEVRRITMNDME